MEECACSDATSAVDASGLPSGSRNDDMNEPLHVQFGLGLESAENDEMKPSFATNSTSTTFVEGVEPRDLDCKQEDGGNDYSMKSLSAGNLDATVESGGDGGDDLNENNDDEETDVFEENTESLASPRYVKIVIGLILLMIILFAIIDSAFGKNYGRQAMTAFLEWASENPGAGVVAFILVYFITNLICIPAALLTVGAGFVFTSTNEGSLTVGVAIGVSAIFVGSCASSFVAFLLARYLLYDRVRRLSQKYSIFEALDIALSEKGFRIMCLLRLSPITPYVLLNYIAGVTTVKLSHYMLSIFCILPGAILYVFIGASAGSLTEKSENKTLTIVAVSVGVVFGGLAIALTSHYSRQELNKEVDLVRSRLYSRTTSRRNMRRYKRNSLRRQRSRYRRRIDRKRLGLP